MNCGGRQALWVSVFLAVAAATGLESVTVGVPGYAGRVQLWVAVPQDARVPEKLPVILALPAGAGSEEMVRQANSRYWEAEALRRRFVVVAPELAGLELSRQARRLVPSILGEVARRYPVDRDRVIIAGVAEGGVGAAGCFLQFPERFRGMLLLPGGPVQGVDVPKTIARKHVYLLVGSNDGPWIEKTEALIGYLKRAKVDVRYEVLPGQGHELDIPPAKLFDWIEETVAP